jgi:hypothetical protein
MHSFPEIRFKGGRASFADSRHRGKAGGETKKDRKFCDLRRFQTKGETRATNANSDYQISGLLASASLATAIRPKDLSRYILPRSFLSVGCSSFTFSQDGSYPIPNEAAPDIGFASEPLGFI